MKFLNHNLFTGDITVNGTTTLSTATGVTRPTGDNTTHLATTAFVKAQDYATNTALGNYVPISRTLTINGVTYDLSANRSWTIATADYTSTVKHVVKAGVAITKGQAIYVTSADGTNMIVGLASNATEATSSKTMGLAETTVSANGFTNVITEGLLAGLDTSTAGTEGDPVWLGTNGNLIYGLANKPYAPAHLVFIGIVTRKNANNGEIFVKVQNGFELNEIHDVDLKTVVPVNGHILGFDGTLWVNKTIAGWLGYTPANASGTTNYLSKFTGTTTLGNSLIYDNGTGVGVGTTDISGGLHVNYSAANTLLLQRISDDSGPPEAIGRKARGTLNAKTGVTANDRLWFFAAAGYIGTEGVDGAWSANKVGMNFVASENWTSAAQGTHITWATTEIGQTTRTDKMILTGAGNLGIGTTSPTYKLDVEGSVNGEFRAASFVNTNTGTGAYGEINVVGNDATLRIGITNANYGGQWTGGGAYFLAPGGMFFGPGGNYSVSMLANGNVGIGTTSPSNKLQVANGDMSITTGYSFILADTDTNWRLGRNIISPVESVYLNSNTFEFVAANASDQGWQFINDDGYPVLEIGAATGSRNVWVNAGNLLVPTGSVGIGTTAPQQKLDVYGNISLGSWTKPGSTYVGLRRNDDGSFGGGGDSGLVIESYNHAAPYTGDYSQRVHLRSHLYNGGSHNVLTAYGINVGIGIDTPSEKLHVVGRARITTIDNGTGDFATISGTGVITRRTAAQVLSDIGAQPSGSYLTAESDTLATVTSRGNTTTGSITVLGGMGASETTDGFGLEIMGNYTNGQYNHRLSKFDKNGGVPLYVQSTSGTANVWSNSARFGTYSGNGYEFEVYGAAKTNGDFASTGQINASGGNSSQWNTAYGWGNHASAGYLTSYTETDTLATVTSRGSSTNGSIFINGIFTGGLGAVTTSGTLDWNDVSNARAGQGYTLLLGTATNGMGGGQYYHPVSFEYSSKNGSGNMTQLAIPYTGNGIWYRNRYGGSWSSWARVWDDSSFTSTNITNWNTAYGWGNHASQGYATQTYVNTAIANLVDSAPSTLDTLNELAAALGDDPNFATTVTNSIATKLPLAGGTMTGKIFTVSTGTGTYDTAIEIREQGYVTTSQSAWGYSPAMTFHWGGRHAIRFGLRSDGLMAVDDAPIALRSWVQAQGYLTSESDTLNSVTGRGNTTSNSVRFGSHVDLSPTGSAFRFYDGTTFRGGLGLDDWAHGGSAANITAYVEGNNNFFISTSGVKRAQFNSGAAIFRTYSVDTAYNIRITGGDQFNAYYNDSVATLYLQYHNGNGGTLNVGNGKLTVNTAGSVVASGDMRAPIFYDSNDTNYYLDLSSSSNSSYAAGVFRQNDGKYVRDSSYRTYSGYSDYYSAGNAGWYRVAEITLTANCSGAVLYGTLYDHRYDGADAYQVSIVARAECSFTSDNEQHYINVGCTILGSTNYVDYKSKIRVVLSASSAGSRTYEVQFYETNWNHDTWQLESTGWTVYTTPQAPRTAVGTPRVYYVSNQNADYQRANTATYSPVYYDSDDTTYYADFNSTSGSAIKLRGGILTGPNPSWSQYLQLGGDGNNPSHATVAVTNGNLHIDAKNGYATYINHYYGNKIHLGSGGAAGGTYTHSNFSLAGNLNLGGGDGDASHRLQVIGNALVQGTQGFNAAGETASLYIGDTASEIRAVYDGGLDFYQNSVHRVRIEGGTGNFGIGTSDPNYKLHVAGNAYINETLFVNQQTTIEDNLLVTQGIGQNNLIGRPAVMWSAGGASTGAIVIKFPGNTANYGMVHAVVDIYEYNGNTVSTIIIGGHNWNSAWYSYGANLIGQTDKQVRLAVVDGSYAIVIGDNSSSWSYGQVVLRKIQNGGYYQNVMNVYDGYTASQTTSLSASWISADLRRLVVSGVITANGGNSGEWNTAYSWGNHASAGYATTSYVTTQINNLINGAPGALDTLDELAAALGDDANFATTVTNSIAGKVSKSGESHDTILPNSLGAGQGGFYTVASGYGPSGGNDALIHIPYANSEWAHQIAMDWATGNSQDMWFRTKNDGTWQSWKKVWHDGNFTDNSSNWNTAYGWGNHASAGYLTTESDTLATVTGRGATTSTALTFSGGSGTTPTLALDRNIATPSNYYSGLQFEVRATSGTAGIGLHRNGYSHVGIYHDSTNELKFNMNSGTPVLSATAGTIWGSGNDGAGSGLDADLLDGQHGSYYQPASSAITTSNIASQSVSYATSAGSSTNLYGPAGSYIKMSTSGTSYQNNYQIRENDGGGSNTNEIYAPQLAFHWSGVVASSIMMEASGRIAIRNNPGTGYEAFIAGIVYSSGYGNSTEWNTAYSWGNHAGLYAAASHTHDDRYYTESESDSRFVNVSGDTMNGSLSFDAAAVIKKRITGVGDNPVKTASGVLASRSDNGGGAAYYIIETNVPQDEYQMGGFTIELFGRYGETNNKTKIDLGGYWNPEGNGGFIGFEAHGTNPQYKPTIEVARNNSTGKTAFIIYGVSWSYPVIVARDLWLGYSQTDGGAYGEGWLIASASNLDNYSNRDTVVWRNAYSDSNPAGYISSESDTLATVTGRGASTSTAVSLSGGATISGITNNGDLVNNGKIVVQNSTNGTNARGIFMWQAGDSNWGIYMATSASGVSLAGGNSVASIDGRTSHHIRFRAYNATGNGFIWENDSEQCVMSLTTDTGNLYTRGQIYAGNSTSNLVWHSGNLTNLNQLTNGPGYITGNQTITLSGDVSGSGTTSISVTVNNIDGWGFVNTGGNSATDADTINSNGISYYTGGVTNFSGNSTDGALYSQRYSDSWQHQIAGDYRSGQIALRGKNNGTWQAWRTVLDSSNFTSWAVSTTYNSSLNSDTRNSRGVTRLYRRDSDSDYSVQVHWTGAHWFIRGYEGDTLHAEARVGYADSAGSAGSASSATSATQVVTIQDAPPSGSNGQLWWESDTGKLKVYYGSSSAWVDATPVPDMSLYYAKAGGPISGDVTVQQTLTVVGNTLIQGTLTETSDISLKENIVPLESSLDKVMQLNGVSFNKKATPNVKEIGFIAQEVEAVIPDLVTETNEGIKTVSYSRVTAVLVETIKEQQAQIEELKNMVSMLAEKLNGL